VPVKVKICGVRTVADARAAVDSGADFLGLNFHPASPRCLDEDAAASIAAAVSGVRLVGVFVDAPRAQMERLASRLALWGVQLHGDEEPAACRGFGTRTIKAIRARPGEDLAARAAPYDTDYLLLDTFVAGQPGGTGVALDLARGRGIASERLFVAGGLRPETVAEAVRTLRPFAVDVASGVESAPGIKDHGKIEDFIRRAKAA
jgi:phosphoribosylanthranilate isomerase